MVAPVDAGGLRVDAVERALCEGPLRAIYVTSHHQYPTTVPLAPDRRRALLELAARHGTAVLEDDYDHEFHYDGRPVLPLASADRAGVECSVGTLSKVVAPGRLDTSTRPPWACPTALPDLYATCRTGMPTCTYGTCADGQPRQRVERPGQVPVGHPGQEPTRRPGRRHRLPRAAARPVPSRAIDSRS